MLDFHYIYQTQAGSGEILILYYNRSLQGLAHLCATGYIFPQRPHLFAHSIYNKCVNADMIQKMLKVHYFVFKNTKNRHIFAKVMAFSNV